MKEHLVSSEEPPEVTNTKLKKIHEMFMSLKETQPVLYLQWIQLVFLFGFHDEDWWIKLQGCYTTYMLF